MRFSKFGRDGHGHDDGDVNPHVGGQFWHHHFDASCWWQAPHPPAKIEYRSFDGSGNNRADARSTPPARNLAASAPAHFADGISVPLGGNNPRTISNLVVGAGDADVANPEGVSAFMYAWGQFIDHDLTLTRTDGVNDIERRGAGG